MSLDVCVVGSFMMDLVLRAPRRPERGETIVGTGFETFLGGKGFNQAVAAARAGARTAMVGRLGDDDFGQHFRAALEREQIDTAAVASDPDIGTGVGAPLVEDGGENSIVIVPRANHAMTAAHVRAARETIERARVVLLQLELPADAIVEAAKIARDAGALVVLNPAPAVSPLGGFSGLVDYVIPNETEAAHFTGVECGDDALDEVAGQLRKLTGAGGVVLTLGERGALVVDGDDSRRIAGHTVPCIDTVGAGDAFCGAMAARLAAGDSLYDAARFGNAAGALAVGVPGAEPSMPARADIERLLG